MLKRRVRAFAHRDLEKQDTSESEISAAANSDDVTRATALRSLSKQVPEQVPERANKDRLNRTQGIFEEWPGLRGYCRYLEGCFMPLLEEKYACIWTALDLRRPTRPVECWALFKALNEAVQAMNESTSIARILGAMTHSQSHQVDADRVFCLTAIFSVLCWSSMTLQPKLLFPGQSAPGLSARRDSHSEQIDLKLEAVHRPIGVAFRGALPNHCSGPWRRPIRDTNVEQSTVLHMSTLNLQSLQDIGKLRIRWVDDLSSHLDFEYREKNLAVFRFPSFCALTAVLETKGAVFEAIARALYAVDLDASRDVQYNQQLSQEVLMSYRLLFGQTRGSRKRVQRELHKLKQKPDYDEFLERVCCQPHRQLHRLPTHLWPVSCRSVVDETLQEEDTYSSQDDFPLLGQRLLKLQEYNLRQQPSRLRDLWRDRRVPFQWYTFWAVLIFGSISVLIALLQLATAIVAIPTAQSDSCDCVDGIRR